jgi:hypothetical protein
MIVRMVRIESVRFGRHIDIEVRYKILRLEIPKLVLILHYLACFKRGCLEVILSKNTLGPLGVKTTLLLHFTVPHAFALNLFMSRSSLFLLLSLFSYFLY